MELYSIYDTKAQEYGEPVLVKNEEVAKRFFAQAISKSPYPEDFKLAFLAHFDVESGFIFDAVSNVKIASRFVEE